MGGQPAADLLRIQLADCLRILAGAEQRAEQAEQKLAEADAILTAIADGILIYDLEGRIVRLNGVAEEMLGYSAAETDAPIGERAPFLRPLKLDGSPYLPAEFPAVRALQGEVVCNQEMVLHVPARGGEALVVTVSSAPIRGQAGQIVGAVTTVVDITARMRMQNELAETAEGLRRNRDELEDRVRERTAELADANTALRYQAYLLANISDAVAAFDAGLHITAWNPAAADLTGWQEHEVLGRTAGEVMRGDLVGAEGPDLYRTLLQAGRFRGELRLRHRDGRQIPVEATIVALHDEGGQVSGYVAASRDIRERLQAEQARQQQQDRLEILHEIDQAILSARSPADIANAAVRRIRQAVPAGRATVVLFNFEDQTVDVLAGDGVGMSAVGTELPMATTMPSVVEQVRRGHEVSMPDTEYLDRQGVTEPVAAGMRSFLAVPLKAAGQVIGALSLWREPLGGFALEHRAFARQVADSLAVAVHNARLFEQVQAGHQQLQTLTRRLVEVQEHERRALARELHDEAGQALTAMTLSLGMLEQEKDCSERMRTGLSELKETTRLVMDDLHRMAANLRPPSLDRLGLIPALRQYVETTRRQSKLAVDLVTSGIEGRRLPPEMEAAFYRIVQESMTNIIRHAHATRVGIIVERRLGRVVAIIEDDGVGFDVEKAGHTERLGLFGMRERAHALGGTLHIESAPGSGTTVFVEVQLATDDEPKRES